MDAHIQIEQTAKGGACTRKTRTLETISSGVISPCSSRGPKPNPAATRGVSLQASVTQRNGRTARRAERENGPAAPFGDPVRDKEKP
jgi:hypothetical protein